MHLRTEESSLTDRLWDVLPYLLVIPLGLVVVWGWAELMQGLGIALKR